MSPISGITSLQRNVLWGYERCARHVRCNSEKDTTPRQEATNNQTSLKGCLLLSARQSGQEAAYLCYTSNYLARRKSTTLPRYVRIVRWMSNGATKMSNGTLPHASHHWTEICCTDPSKKVFLRIGTTSSQGDSTFALFTFFMRASIVHHPHAPDSIFQPPELRLKRNRPMERNTRREE
ncbi:hypothetical protein DL89DRAFT_23579 [Linderina pennispora]|uniref:Uncharacterized protein n=1 Tax=Linderina pennispora TaxID=61395 RepID=A0A1Y1WN97_9FUNG|nr:uncharacterized protein DL89DRAFT_23579 [Linderina pennispora]ORX74845.1 hypothetical protein DL89DRAFT_23579 [Linderina pennispora]